VSLVEQVEIGASDGQRLVLQPQRLVMGFPVPTSKTLQIAGAAAATEYPQLRHQQEEPLGVTHHTAEPPIRDGLEKAGKIARDAVIVCVVLDFGHGGQSFPPTELHAVSPAKTYVDRFLGITGGGHGRVGGEPPTSRLRRLIQEIDGTFTQKNRLSHSRPLVLASQCRRILRSDIK